MRNLKPEKTCYIAQSGKSDKSNLALNVQDVI